MRIDPAYLDAETAYRLITGVVVPRPIAWVTSLSATGVLNLAPFSAFTFVSPKPPMLAISVGRKGNIYKDTAQNILNNEQYVVHIADSSLMNAVHESLAEMLKDPAIVEKFYALGAEAVSMTPAEFTSYLEREDAKWIPVVRKANIKAD